MSPYYPGRICLTTKSGERGREERSGIYFNWQSKKRENIHWKTQVYNDPELTDYHKANDIYSFISLPPTGCYF